MCSSSAQCTNHTPNESSARLGTKLTELFLALEHVGSRGLRASGGSLYSSSVLVPSAFLTVFVAAASRPDGAKFGAGADSERVGVGASVVDAECRADPSRSPRSRCS